MTVAICRAVLAVVLLMPTVDAADSSAASASIAPVQVTLGMSMAALKTIRPEAFDGPEASRPDDLQQRKWPTMMEIADLGQPSQISYWYLFSKDKLIGLLRIRSLVLVEPGERNVEASSAYNAFAELLGVPRQESVLRKGDVSFVPVRTDVWTDDVTRFSFYFIATTKEITTAVLAPSDFPMEQVLIRPDSERFEVEDKATQTVTDLPRSLPSDENSVSRISRTPLPFGPPIPQPKREKPSRIEEQPKDDRSSFRVWALVIPFALVGLWMAWRAISKSHQGGPK